MQDDVEVLPILTPQAPISHFKTCIGPEFIKMIQKNNKITYIYFYLCWRGQDKPAWTACPPGVKITRVGGKIFRDSLPPGGQAVQGGKINCHTGTHR